MTAPNTAKRHGFAEGVFAFYGGRPSHRGRVTLKGRPEGEPPDKTRNVDLTPQLTEVVRRLPVARAAETLTAA